MTDLFASTELAARVESAQCGLLTDCLDGAAARRPTATWVRSIAGGVATLIAGEISPLNKVAGVGFAGPLDEAQLHEVELQFFDHDTAVQIELSTLADPSIAAMLTRRGYVLVGFEHIMGRRLSPHDAPPLVDGVEISSSPDPELNVWLDAVVTGFTHPDDQGVASHEQFSRETLTRVIADMASAPNFSRYLARVGHDGPPAGGASLRRSEGVAQLCGAATLPGFRCRGVQAGLLAARLHAAAAGGCDLAVVTTPPGSRSQHNVQRRGFALLYARAVLVRQPPRSG